jgi:hypothetical protein
MLTGEKGSSKTQGLPVRSRRIEELLDEAQVCRRAADSRGSIQRLDGGQQITNPAAGQLDADHAIALGVGAFRGGIDNLVLSSGQDDVPAG